MTLRLNFDKTKLKKLVTLIEWLKDTGMITSFKLEKSEAEETEEDLEYEISDEEASEILQLWEDAKKGNYLTDEEFRKTLKYG